MTGADRPVPDLPRTWRPIRARIVGYTLALVVAAGGVVLAVALPSSGGTTYHAADRVGISIVGVSVAAALLVLVRPRLDADEDGLTVTNFLTRHRLTWSEVVGVDMAPTESWIALDLADGTALPVVAVQTADGARFRAAVLDLELLVLEHSGRER